MNSAAPGKAAVASAPAVPRLADRMRARWRVVADHRGSHTAQYLFSTDTHTFAFSVAANAILSCFPFLLMMLTLTRRLDHFLWKHLHLAKELGMNGVVLDLVRDYLPLGTTNAQRFVTTNFDALARARSGVQVLSVVMLLITSTGVFLPLEVALNRIWGFHKNRNYLMNQLVSLGLAFAFGLLALVSVFVTAATQRSMETLMLGYTGVPFQVAAWMAMKVYAILTTMTIFFLIYWLLPNGRVPARKVAPAAIITGLLWEASKYVYVLFLPLLDFQSVYGPFYLSVTLIFWAFISGLLLLAGAHLCAGQLGVE